MDSWFWYQLEFKDKYFDKHHRLNDDGKALVDKGLQKQWRGSKPKMPFRFKTKKDAEKQLRSFPKEISKHYKVVELMGLSCFSI